METEVQLFDKASGNVRGFATTTVILKGKRVRVAHATLLVDAGPDISISVPKRLSLEEIDQVAQAMKDFSAKVASLKHHD